MFSIERRILTAVVLTASLVVMAVGQQPAPGRASKQRPPVSATPAAAAQLPSRIQTPQAAPTPAALQNTREPSTPGPALAPVAIAGKPSTVLTTAARTPSAQAAPSSASSSVRPSIALTAARTPSPQGAPSSTSSSVRPTVAPAAAADWQVLPFQTPRASTAPPAAAIAPIDTLEPGQQSTTRTPPTQARPASAQTPQATQRSPDYVEEKGFKGRVFEIKHRDPDSLAQILRPLGSGFKGATISANREFKILSVRDFPENIAAMDEAIKRLDTPEARSPDIEFTVHIIIASNGEASGGEIPSELGPVLKQLQSTLRYKTYNLMTSAIHRGKEGPVRVENSGIAESRLLGVTTPQGNPIFFNYSLQRISLDGAATSATVQVGDFNFHMRGPLLLGAGGQIAYENIGFNTPVSMREGEKVVVGTTSMGDKGLIVVVSAKVLK